MSGVPELVEDGVTGRLVPPGDAEALADALIDIQRDPAGAARLADAGRARVLASFDLRTNTRHLAERFIEVARAAGRRVEPLSPETGDQAETPSP